MDRRTPYTLSVLAPSTDGRDESRTQIQGRLREFVLEFQLDNAFIYRYVCRAEGSFYYVYGCRLTGLGVMQRPAEAECTGEAVFLRYRYCSFDLVQ